MGLRSLQEKRSRHDKKTVEKIKDFMNF